MPQKIPQNPQQTNRPDYTQGHAQSLRYTLNRFIVLLARLILVGLLVNLIVQAFAVSLEAGIKSIAATILPLLITAYISFSSRSRHVMEVPQGVLDVALYLLSGIWIIFLLLFTRYAALSFNREVPLGEVALSITLSFLILIAGRLSYKSIVACSYGIISGLLTYVLIFGLSF